MDRVAEGLQGRPREPIRGRQLTRVACSIVGLNLRARMEYRGDFALSLLYGLIFQAAALAFVWVIVARFHGIGSWTYHEVLFIAGLRLIAHAIYVPIFDNIAWVPRMVREGLFDRVLLRPMNPLLQVLLYRFSANGLGDLSVGLVAFGVAQRGLSIHWTPFDVAFLLMVIVGAVLLEAGINLALSTLSFWFVAVDALLFWSDDSVNTFGNYPVTIYPSATRAVFTFLFPIALLAAFPASAFLGRAGDVPFTPALAYGAPFLGSAGFIVAYQFWLIGSRHNRSTGT